jgi:hypothetical protein
MEDRIKVWLPRGLRSYPTGPSDPTKGEGFFHGTYVKSVEYVFSHSGLHSSYRAYIRGPKSKVVVNSRLAAVNQAYGSRIRLVRGVTQ